MIALRRLKRTTGRMEAARRATSARQDAPDKMKRLATDSTWWQESPTLSDAVMCRNEGGQPWIRLAWMWG